ncbi:helicase C-terminal domain-containing protein [Actinacidiphila bryophytorum]|uniref:WYL domain-containing protein n=3 Tax=Actinacidiphila bryophytorum TaxID=1436133 RepID=A0A9W4M9C5_9ACTN|nr:helicase C-terminal domain-containing protein [Actinacidiphila bryophytorum]MBM9439459.1 helicase C-terminal domain-containing protein [Actinacidiphila bryophytorum]CAG7639616.1 WYL domain-containing protein [Actinacidiphila bryophytorum]
MTTGGSSGAPRTLAEDLRARDDDALSALLRARPDLLAPVPSDLTQLATRAATRTSVVRALDHLDAFTQQTAEALAVTADGCPYATLRELMTGRPPVGGVGEALDPEVAAAVEAELPRAVAALRAHGLVWGEEDRLRLVRTARDVLAPSAATPSATGLGPSVAEATAGMSPARLQEVLSDAGLAATHDPSSAITALAGLFADPDRFAALLAQAPDGARAVLDRLVWGPPYGEVRDATAAVRAAGAATPVQWLLARGLLLPAGQHNVVLPREAALALRAGRAHRTPQPLPPPMAPVQRTVKTVDATAAGQAFTAVRTVTDLLKEWETGGPAVLRAGGISVRDLRRTAAALDLTEPQTAFWLELAYAAGLVAADGEVDEAYAPTPAADEWLLLPAERQWAALAAAWLAATRTAGLVGTRDPKGRALAALGPDLDRSLAPRVRGGALRLLAALPPGSAAGREDLLTRLRWDRPLRAAADALREDLLRWTLEDAEALGVTGRGALAAHSRPLLAAAGPDTDRAAALLAPLLPEALDHVLLQADLTAVAPGPLIASLAETLGVLADIESKGGATVYRFTPESVRRALDAGRTAAELQAFLAEHSRTPVPQPLSYLIDDMARRHGTLRVGAAAAYLRCDDDALLTELLADRRASGLRLRRLAPTVLAAQADPSTLLERLRAMGLAPAAESADGDVLITRPDARRTPPRSAPVPVPDGPPVPDTALLALAVKAIRAGDRAATAVHRPPTTPPAGVPRTAAADTLATVQSAVLTGESLWIGYVNAEGTATQRVITPVRVEGGYVTAYDHTADEVRTFAIHRVTGVSELADEPPS